MQIVVNTIDYGIFIDGTRASMRYVQTATDGQAYARKYYHGHWSERRRIAKRLAIVLHYLINLIVTSAHIDDAIVASGGARLPS